MANPVGVLGGMGPLATFDFCLKVVAETAAETDQENLPLLVYSVPQIPDRIAGMLGTGPSPLPALREGMQTLLAADVGCLAMPCNTAHHWYDALAAEAPVPFLHIADAACTAASRQARPGDAVGLIATSGTIRAGFYPMRLERAGFTCLTLEEEETRMLVGEGIRLVKRGEVPAAGALFAEAVRRLMDRGAACVILGCTEVPVGIDASAPQLSANCVDATRALARACVDWYRRQEARSAPGADGASTGPDLDRSVPAAV